MEDQDGVSCPKLDPPPQLRALRSRHAAAPPPIGADRGGGLRSSGEGGEDPGAAPGELPSGVFLEWEMLKSKGRIALEDHFNAEQEFLMRVIDGYAPAVASVLKKDASQKAIAMCSPSSMSTWGQIEQMMGQGLRPAPAKNSPPPDRCSPASMSQLTERSASFTPPSSPMSKLRPSSTTERFPEPKRSNSRMSENLSMGSGLELRVRDFTQDWSLKNPVMVRLADLAHWWAHLQEPKRTSRLARIVNGFAFQMLCTAMIVCYSALLVKVTDYTVLQYAHDQEKPPAVYLAMEQAINVFFMVELSLRMKVHGWYYFCNNSMAWNVFDFILVMFALYEVVMNIITSNTSSDMNMTFLRSLRMLKVAKALRVIRAVRFVTQLRLMINSIVGSVMSLFWCVCLLLIAFFLFSLAFVQGVAAYLSDQADSVSPEDTDTILSAFGSVSASMMTLFRCATGGDDWGVFYDVIRPTGTFNNVAFVFFILFLQVALLNIVTGVFIEHAMKVAQPEINQLAFEQRKRDLEDAKVLRTLFDSIDRDKSGTISWEEFSGGLMTDPRVRASLAVLGLDVRDAATFFKMVVNLDEDSDAVDIEFFVESCLKMKGQATSIDLLGVAYETKVIHRSVRALEQELRGLVGELGPLSSGLAHVAKIAAASSPRDEAKADLEASEPERTTEPERE